MRGTMTKVSDLGTEAGQAILEAIRAVLAEKGTCRVGLSGGRTPGPVFAFLKEHLTPNDYNGLVVTWVDERVLPVDGELPGGFHADSNAKLAFDTWLSSVPSVCKVLPMAVGGSGEEELQRFSHAFAEQAGNGLDVAILGVGEDGHVCSLFPGFPQLAEDAPVALVEDSPKPPPTRLTVTLPVLNAAEHVFVLTRGAGKAEILEKVQSGDPALPVNMIHNELRFFWEV